MSAIGESLPMMLGPVIDLVVNAAITSE